MQWRYRQIPQRQHLWWPPLLLCNLRRQYHLLQAILKPQSLYRHLRLRLVVQRGRMEALLLGEVLRLAVGLQLRRRRQRLRLLQRRPYAKGGSREHAEKPSPACLIGQSAARFGAAGGAWALCL